MDEKAITKACKMRLKQIDLDSLHPFWMQGDPKKNYVFIYERLTIPQEVLIHQGYSIEVVTDTGMLRIEKKQETSEQMVLKGYLTSGLLIKEGETVICSNLHKTQIEIGQREGTDYRVSVYMGEETITLLSQKVITKRNKKAFEQALCNHCYERVLSVPVLIIFDP